MKTVAAMVLWCTFVGSVAPQPHKIKTYPSMQKCQAARVKYESHNISRSVRCACKRQILDTESYKPGFAINTK
jgi:hypothetical protein